MKLVHQDRAFSCQRQPTEPSHATAAFDPTPTSVAVGGR
jgi:hypothetical protein